MIGARQLEISAHDMASLKGEVFLPDYQFKLVPDHIDRKYLTRRELLTDLCSGKNIIHLGCVDHNIHMIKEKIQRGKWLHADLVDAANRCLGIDLNQEGLDYIRKELAIDDLLCSNIIENTSDEILSQNWDFFLIPEVLEHQDNPVNFLSELRKKYGAQVGQFVITVPNAFAENNFSNAYKNLESINSDHRFWFTPYTLTKNLVQAGFSKITLRLCRNGVIKKRAFLKNIRLAKNPLLRNNIIAVAS